MIFQICKETLKVKNGQEFIVDSFPVPCCQNNKIFRCKILKGKEYRGYTASKKTYFFGIKVHMITTVQGIPVEFVFTPGSESDVRGLRRFECDLREGSILYADKAYTDYIQEDLLQDACQITLLPKRKKNSTRQNSAHEDFFLSLKRNRIETTFSSITHLMPRCIQATTSRGFFLKVLFFILGYTVKRVFQKT